MPHEARADVATAPLPTTASHELEVWPRWLTPKHVEVASSFGLGAISGMIGISAVFPIDVVKTRLQNRTQVPRISAIGLMRHILAKEGIRAFYKGLVPQLYGTGPDKALSLGVRHFLTTTYFANDPTAVVATAVAGAGAGAVQSSVMSPVEMVKVRMQINSSLRMTGIIRDLGLRGLYRGFSACFLRDIAFSATYFTFYEAAKRKFKVQDGASRNLSLCLAAGVSAGIPAAFLTTPLDVLKTRMQAANESKPLLRVVTDVYRSEGLGAFFNGYGPRVTRIAPQFGIVLVTYDTLKDWSDNWVTAAISN